MQARAMKIVSRSVTSLAIGMAVTAGSVSLASASSGHDNGKNHDCASGRISLFDYASGGIGGYVTAVTVTSMTVQGWDGTSTTFTLTPATTYAEGSTASTIGSLVVGDRVKISTSSSAPTTATAVKIELAELFGKVTAVSGSTITVSDPEGFSRTIVVSSATKYSVAGVAGALTSVTVGSKVFASGTIDANRTSLDALSIVVGSAGHKEDVRGIVTAATATSVTVASHHGASTTFTYSPTTIFSEGSATVSAASLVAGDKVSVEFNSAAPTTALKVSVKPVDESGVVTAVSGSTVTIKDFQGFTRTLVVSSSTTYRTGHTTSALTAVVVGSKIDASGVIASDGTTLVAQTICIQPVSAPKPIVPVVSVHYHDNGGRGGNYGFGQHGHDSFGQHGHDSFGRGHHRR